MSETEITTINYQSKPVHSSDRAFFQFCLSILWRIVLAIGAVAISGMIARYAWSEIGMYTIVPLTVGVFVCLVIAAFITRLVFRKTKTLPRTRRLRKILDVAAMLTAAAGLYWANSPRDVFEREVMAPMPDTLRVVKIREAPGLLSQDVFIAFEMTPADCAKILASHKFSDITAGVDPNEYREMIKAMGTNMAQRANGTVHGWIEPHDSYSRHAIIYVSPDQKFGIYRYVFTN